MVSSWFRSWFNNDYLALYAHRDKNEAEQWVDLAVKKLDLTHHHILDLCCGAGRHLALLRKRGLFTVGLDLSRTLLSESRKDQPDAPLVQAEMLHLPFKNCFDIVLNFFTSFGYYRQEKDNQRVLAQIRRVLRTGGRFLIDCPNRQKTIDSLIPESRSTVQNHTVVQKRHYNPDTRRLIKKIEWQEGPEAKTYEESVRLYSPAEFESLLKAQQLRLDEICDESGRPFASQSERMVLIGRS